jgi:hypothetical protein
VEFATLFIQVNEERDGSDSDFDSGSDHSDDEESDGPQPVAENIHRPYRDSDEESNHSVESGDGGRGGAARFFRAADSDSDSDTSKGSD